MENNKPVRYRWYLLNTGDHSVNTYVMLTSEDLIFRVEHLDFLSMNIVKIDGTRFYPKPDLQLKDTNTGEILQLSENNNYEKPLPIG